MKRILQIAFLITLLISGAIFLPAQDSKKTSDDTDATITTIYDEKKGETEIELKMLNISNNNQQIFLSVSSTFSGEKLKKRPKDIVFIVSIVSIGGYQYPDMMKMKVSADGKKIPEVLMLNLDKRPLDEKFLETIGTRMDYDVFRRIAQSQKTQLELSGTKINLNKTHLDKLDEFEKTLNP